MSHICLTCGVACLLFSVPAAAQAPATAHQRLTGVYEIVSDPAALPRGVATAPAAVTKLPLTAAALAIQKTRSPEDDPANVCQVVGPFRMMAWPGNKIELYVLPSRTVMMFEDIAHGNKREIYFTRPHPAGLEPLWNGDSIGRWEGDTLVVDTVGFNDRTWLDGAGAPHSDALHLIERLRLVGDGTYLEVVSTAEDPQMLAKPFSYARYYKRIAIDAFIEDTCQESIPPPPVPTAVKAN